MHEAIKVIANYFIFISLGAVVYMFVQLKHQQRIRFALVLVAGGLLSLLLAKVGAHLYNDPRPFVQGHFTPLLKHAADNGFPSDHTLLAGLIGWVVFAYRRKLGVALLLLAALIGSARMAAGVHHLSDIVGSFIFTALSAWAAYQLVQWLYARRQKQLLG